jgi:2-iminoacetate synthase
MTLKEYLTDYAGEETKKVGEELIKNQVGDIPSLKVRSIVEERLEKIENGSRDFRF